MLMSAKSAFCQLGHPPITMDLNILHPSTVRSSQVTSNIKSKKNRKNDNDMKHEGSKITSNKNYATRYEEVTRRTMRLRRVQYS